MWTFQNISACSQTQSHGTTGISAYSNGRVHFCCTNTRKWSFRTLFQQRNIQIKTLNWCPRRQQSEKFGKANETENFREKSVFLSRQHVPFSCPQGRSPADFAVAGRENRTRSVSKWAVLSLCPLICSRNRRACKLERGERGILKKVCFA